MSAIGINIIAPHFHRLATLSGFVFASFVVQGISAAPPETREDITREGWRQSSLLRAGQADGGLMLEARVLGHAAVANEPVNILLSVRNVSDVANGFFHSRGEIPEVWVWGEDGKPTSMTKKGREWYEPVFRHVGADSGLIVKLEPGEAFGTIHPYPLSKYFALDRPGNYTVLMTTGVVGMMLKEENGRSGSGTLVAKPLTIKVSARNSGVGEIDDKATAASAKRSIVANEPTDKEWTAQAAESGRLAGGCVLEAIDCPAATGKAELIVSLLCEEVPTKGSNRTTFARQTTHADYRLLVRDRFGRPIAPRHNVPMGTPEKPAVAGDEHGKNLRLGDAMGTLIPLKKYFDFKEAGEYWVLVTLPSRKADEPEWVAEPIRVRVNAEPPALDK